MSEFLDRSTFHLETNLATSNFATSRTVSDERYFPVAIIGGGPAGTGPLMAALQQGKLGSLLQEGVAIFEGGQHLISGQLGNYQVNSDTLANAYLEIFDNDPDSLLSDLKSEPETLALNEYVGSSVPLPIVADFLKVMGDHLKRVVASHPASNVYLNTLVHSACQQADGSFLIHGIKNEVPFKARCGKLILATGGKQSRSDTLTKRVSGKQWLSGPLAAKSLLTGQILGCQSGENWKPLLTNKADPSVVIIGSSHSAFSTAWKLLQDDSGINFSENGIKILYRTRPKVYFGTPEEARQAGYHSFDSRDICSKTGRLFRLAGMRFDGRELLMQVLGLGGRNPEPRVRMKSLDEIGDHFESTLEAADLIVPAFGYRPKTIDIYDTQGIRIPLCSDSGGRLVDQKCRVLENRLGTSTPIENVYGIGLASGFVPSGKLGGELSFRGQTNGHWLYQNDVGNIILHQILKTLANV